MEIRAFRQEEIEEVTTLWERCELFYDQADMELIIERKLHYDPELFLVAVVAGEIVGTVMGGFDGCIGTAYYLAVHPAFRKRAFANELLSRLEKKLKARGCPKMQLIIHEEHLDALGFFERREYDIVEKTVMIKTLIQDEMDP